MKIVTQSLSEYGWEDLGSNPHEEEEVVVVIVVAVVLDLCFTLQKMS